MGKQDFTLIENAFSLIKRVILLITDAAGCYQLYESEACRYRAGTKRQHIY